MVSEKLVGGYSHKELITDTINQYEIPLKMVSIVHHFGSLKYKPFSWYNFPYVSNSSIIDNVNALFRHLGAHSMGKIKDKEGLLHIMHACCRGAMLVSVFYKEESACNVSLPTQNITEPSEWYGFIDHEELLALTKTHIEETDMSILNRNIFKELFQFNELIKNNKVYILNGEIFNECLVDRIFANICTYAKIWWENYGSDEYFDEEIKKDPWLNLICEIKGKKRLKLKEPKHIFTTCSESKNKIK